MSRKPGSTVGLGEWSTWLARFLDGRVSQVHWELAARLSRSHDGMGPRAWASSWTLARKSGAGGPPQANRFPRRTPGVGGSNGAGATTRLTSRFLMASLRCCMHLYGSFIAVMGRAGRGVIRACVGPGTATGRRWLVVEKKRGSHRGWRGSRDRAIWGSRWVRTHRPGQGGPGRGARSEAPDSRDQEEFAGREGGGGSDKIGKA